MLFSTGTFTHIQPQHDPNDGRIIINANFDLITASFSDAFSGLTSGNTVVYSGTNTSVLSGMSIGTGASPFYIVSVIDNPIFSGVVSAAQITATTISADTFYSGSTNLGDLLTGISSSVLYTNSAATPTTLGGISAGSTFSAQTIQEMFDALLYPYQIPAFTAFARTNLSSTYELGQVVLSGAQTFTWSTINSGNISANTISIVQNFSPITTLVNGAANAGTTAVTVNDVYSAASLTTTTLYTISAVNSQNSSFNTTISRTWLPRWYYGKFSGSSINAAQLVTLSNSALVSNVVNAYYAIPSSVSTDYVYFAIPNTLAQPSDFRDSTGGCFGTNWPYSVQGSVVVTNAYGVNITYTVYRFTNPTAGALNAWLCP